MEIKREAHNLLKQIKKYLPIDNYKYNYNRIYKLKEIQLINLIDELTNSLDKVTKIKEMNSNILNEIKIFKFINRHAKKYKFVLNELIDQYELYEYRFLMKKHNRIIFKNYCERLLFYGEDTQRQTINYLINF